MTAPYRNEGPAAPARHPRWPVLLWLGVVLVLGLRLVQLRAFVIDDAFISFRYARNLAEGHGLVFNPGERVEGYSNLAWVLLIAGCTKAGVAPLAAARVLSLLCVCGTFWALYRVSASGQGRGDLHAGLAALGLALNSSFVLWVLAGLETHLMALAVTALLLAMWTERAAAVPWRTALCCALAVLVRPEGVAYATAGCAGLWVVHRMERTGRAGAAFVPVAATVAAAAALTGWRLWYYGEWLPNVFYAKSGGTAYQMGEGVKYIYSFVAGYGHPILLALPVATWLLRPSARPMLVAAGLLGAAGAAFVVYAGGDWMPGHRFLVPAMPLAYLCVQEGGRDLFRALAASRLSGRAAVVGIVAWTLFYAAHCVQFPAADEAARSFGAEHRLAREAGISLAKRAAPGAAVAVADAGAIPHFSGLHAIDRRGLMDKHIARLKRSDFMWKFDEPYVLDQAPAFVESQLALGAGLPRLDEALARGTGFPPDLQPWVRQLPQGVTLGHLARHARWAGDIQLYTNKEFLTHYRPVLVYEVPRLWYVVISQRVGGARR